MKVLNCINKNLGKFSYCEKCSCIHFFEYNNITIKVVNDLFTQERLLFYKKFLVHLNFFERIKLKIIVKKLYKLKNDTLKDKVKEELNDEN